MADMKPHAEELVRKIFGDDQPLRWAYIQGDCERLLVMSIVADYIVNLPMDRYKEQSDREICGKLLEKLIAVKGIIESDISVIESIIENAQ